MTVADRAAWESAETGYHPELLAHLAPMNPPTHALLSVLASLALASCTTGRVLDPNHFVADAGANAGVGDAGARDAGAPDGGAPDAAVTDSGTLDAGGTADAGSVDAGACVLPGRVTVTSVSVVGATVDTGWPMALAPLPADQALLMWTANGGGIHLTKVDASSARSASDIVISGTSGQALAVTPSGYAVLVHRTPAGGLTEELWLELYSPANGTLVQSRRLVGGNSGTVDFDEWFALWAPHARLVWTGTRLSAYFTLEHLWVSTAHQGDTFRHFTLDLDGGYVPDGWLWGCSHSLDVRLAQLGDTVAALCLSDCYPAKGLLLGATQLIASEPSGDCSGSSGAQLGAMVGDSSGVWVSWSTSEGRSSSDIALVHASWDGGVVGAPRWFHADSVWQDSAHLAAFGSGYLLGYTEDWSTSRLQALDSAGAPLGSPLTFNVDFSPLDDFATFPSGDVGWIFSSGNSALELVRVSPCP